MPNRNCYLLVFSAVAALFLGACGGSDSSGSTTLKDCNYANTYDAIQATVFEGRGCTQSTCHGEAMLGGLDLRAGASFDALVRQPSEVDPSIERVFPGDQGLSLLYHKLAAAIDGTDLANRGQPMPIGLDPISTDQLDTLRRQKKNESNARASRRQKTARFEESSATCRQSRCSEKSSAARATSSPCRRCLPRC